ncbi:MAG TPA: hypothetical protein VGH56_09705 [Solirubrobacteraceae bacterium]
MNPELTHQLAQARVADMHRVAGAGQATRAGLARADPDRSPVTFRIATYADALALTRLAELDSAKPLAPPILVAESFGRLVAAVSIDDLRTIADPFEPTAALVELLLIRVGQIRAGREPRRLPRLARVRALLALR